MRTLIKWPGGKTQEFPYIKDLIPSFDRYVEPFFGSGAVFFQLRPKNAIINDTCTELTNFYSLLKEGNKREEFKERLYKYASNWEEIPEYISVFENKFVKLYEKYKRNEVTQRELSAQVSSILKKEEGYFNRFFNREFCLDKKNLLEQVILNLISKISRVREIEK